MIIFLCLIASLTSVYGDQDVGNNFYWNMVGISILTQFLKQAAFKTAAWALYFTFGTINDLSIQHIRLSKFE